MATNVVLNGSTYSIPAVGDSNWGTNLSNFFIAIGSGTLQKTGGAFTLTAETDFGASYGLKSAYLKSRATNPSAAGVVRLGNTELVSWRNAGNSADLGLTVNASNALQFNSVSIVTSGSIVNADVNAAAAIDYSKLNLALSIVNADISASAAIVYSKLSIADADLTIAKTSGLQSALNLKSPAASPTFTGTITTPLTASRAVVTGVSSELAVATTTATEIGFVNGVTSAIQTQLDAKVPKTLTTTTGDMIYASSANTPASLAIGSSNQVIKSVGGVPVWSAAPSGGVNYLSAGTDGDSIASWVTYADAAATSPVDGTGGSPASNFAVSTDSSLRGTTNFLWTHSAANRQGEGFSSNFTIDPSDKGKVIQCYFEYLIASGTYADDDLQFWIYDVTNAVLIQPAPYKLKNSGIIEKFAFEFQTSSSSTSYRLIAHVATSTATAYTIRFDNWNLGPQAKLYGSPITDWVAYTPTFTAFGTVSLAYAFWRRVGSDLEVKARWSNGTVTGSTNAISLPSGLVIDSSIPSYITVGTAVTNTPASATLFSFGVLAAEATGFNISKRSSTTTDLGSGVGTDVGTSQIVTFNAKVPIAGWSSSVVMSSDANTNVIGLNYNGTPTGTLNASLNTATFPTKVTDSSGTYSSGTYTVVTPGLYDASIGVSTNGTYAVGNTVAVSIFIGGVEKYTNYNYAGGALTNLNGNLSVKAIPLAAGDLVTVRISSTGTTPTYTSSTVLNFFSLSRVSGPARIAASDTVSAFYTGTPTGTLNTSYNTVTFPTKVKDTHSSYASGTYTVTQSGTYNIAASFTIGLSTAAAGNYSAILIAKNGTGIASAISRAGVATTEASLTNVVSVNSYPLLAGDLITIKSRTNLGTPVFSAGILDASENTFSIVRVGNY